MQSKRAILIRRSRHPAARPLFWVLYQLDSLMSRFVNPAESLIITGFWRSGTTWLQEVMTGSLNAKGVFEPFHFLVPEMRALLKIQGILAGRPHPNMHMPAVMNGTLEGHPLHTIVAKALRSTLRGRWVRLHRSHWTEVFRRRVVVKFTRAALTLRAIMDTVPNPVLHIVRDPRAVAASVVYKTNHMGGRFSDSFSLAQELLEDEDGRVVYFKRWEKEIQFVDRKSLAVKIGAFWAFSERFLADSMEGAARQPAGMLQYEDLLEGERQAWEELLVRLGYPLPGRSIALDQDSLTTKPSLQQDLAARLKGWQTLLPQQDAVEIAALARDLGHAHRLRE